MTLIRVGVRHAGPIVVLPLGHYSITLSATPITVGSRRHRRGERV